MHFSVHHCTLCPRRCGCDRTKAFGYCGGGNAVRGARAALHFWEEPCISGTNGSGAVFFSGCTLHCCFCQNMEISSENQGKEIPVERLSEIFLELQEKGAHNINLVTAGHYLPWILKALDTAKPRLHIPVVYNCGGYETEESIAALEGYADIFLPDFKYFSPETAEKYASAPDYPETAEKAISRMLRQTGKPVIKNGLLQKGCIIRHMVLPAHRHESIALLHHLAACFGTDTFLLSLMSQYTPTGKLDAFPELKRKITKMEYLSVLKTAQELGFQGYMQEKSSAASEYTPDFDLTGI